MEINLLTLTEQEKREYCPVPPPTPPMKDWRWWTLAVPPFATALGLFLFGILAFAFTELRSISAGWRGLIVWTGAILIPFGSELGTGFTVIEIFRKHKGPEGAMRGDWLGLTVSAVTSGSEIILSWAWLLGIDTTWHESVQVYGPLVLGVVMILDFYAGLMEAGLYLGTYDHRVATWEKKHYHPWLKKMQEQLETQPQFIEQQHNIICWCGATVSDYWDHFWTFHANELRQFSSPDQAWEGLRKKYTNTIPNANVAFPSPHDLKGVLDTIAQGADNQ